MRLLYLGVLFLLSSCFIEDIAPQYEMVCNAEQPDWITFQEVQKQYITYQATTVRDNKTVNHMVVSHLENGATQNELFEFVIDVDSKCVYLKGHKKSIYYSNGEKSLKEETIYNNDQFYFTNFSTLDNKDKTEYILIGENEGSLFYITF